MPIPYTTREQRQDLIEVLNTKLFRGGNVSYTEVSGSRARQRVYKITLLAVCGLDGIVSLNADVAALFALEIDDHGQIVGHMSAREIIELMAFAMYDDLSALLAVKVS